MNIKGIADRVPEIYVVANSADLADNVKRVCDECGDTDIGCSVALLNEGLEIARMVRQRGARVLVSRKGIADLLKKYSGMEVVTITTTMNDYLCQIQRMLEHRGLLGILEYETYIPELERLVENLKLQNVQLFPYSDLDNYAEVVQQAVNSRCTLLIGGGRLLMEEAHRKNIPLGVVENTPDSIRTALAMARQLVSVQKAEEAKRREAQAQSERYRIILNHTQESILSVDADGVVQVVNASAEKLLEKRAADCVGIPIERLLPGLSLPQTAPESPEAVNAIVHYGKKRLSADFIPVVVDGAFVSAVYLMRDVLDIQKSENDIRTKLYTKGNAAKYHFDDILGASESLTLVKYVAAQYAQTDATVMIYGETGVGKEMFAQSIHNVSSRVDSPFVAINCASLGKELLESRLFGYSDGAFTGAAKGGKPGLFEIAHGGTVFLDEIAEIPMETQTQLLRVLQEKEVRRIGSAYTLPIDVRVIAATNKNLASAVAAGQFRQDLYYRLNVLVLQIPPLRSRREDLPLLFRSFLDDPALVDTPEFQQIAPLMAHYGWPGNVRELRAVAERFSLLQHGCPTPLLPEMVFGESLPPAAAVLDPAAEKSPEYARLVAALRRNHFHKTRTAQELGVSRSTLWRALKKHGLLDADPSNQ